MPATAALSTAIQRRLTLAILLAIAAVAVLSLPATATVRYVNDTATVGDSWCTVIGDDNNDGLTPASPKRTITAAVRLSSVGDTVYIDAGTYGETVAIDTDYLALVGVDSTATILDYGDSHSDTALVAIYAETQTGLWVSNLRIKNYYYAIYWQGVERGVVRNTNLSDNGYGILIEFGGWNIVSDNSSCSNTANNGFSILHTYYNLLDNNISNYNRNNGFAVFESCTNTLTNNTSIGNWTGIYMESSDSNAIDGSIISDCRMNVFMHNSTLNRLSNNTISYSHTFGIVMQIFSDTNLVIGNSVSNSAWGGFEIIDSNDNYFYNNIATNNTWVGFRTQRQWIGGTCLNNAFDSNLACENGTGFVFFVESHYTQATNNAAINNTTDGLQMDWSSNCRIEGNLFQGNVEDGLNCAYKNNLFSNNRCIGNGEYGLSTLSAEYSFFIGNIISDNGIGGLWLENDTGSVFIQNTIDSNAGYQIMYGYVDVPGTCYGDRYAVVTKNNLRTSPFEPDSGVCNPYEYTYDLRRNWWGTTNGDSIYQLMAPPGSDSITWQPYRLSVVDTGINADTVAPAAPMNLMADTSIGGQVSLSWTRVTDNEEPAPSFDIAGYRIYRSINQWVADWKDPTLGAGLLGSTADPDTEFIDATAAAGVTYWYRVTAYDENPSGCENESWYGDTLEVTAPYSLRIILDCDSAGLAQTGETFTLSGVVEYNRTDTPATLRVAVNGSGDSDLFVDTPSGTFSTVIALARGLNLFSITVPDTFGVTGAATIGIIRADTIYPWPTATAVLGDTPGTIIAMMLSDGDSGTINLQAPTGAPTLTAEFDFREAGSVVAVELVDETTVANIFEPLASGIAHFRLTDDVIYRFTAMDSAGIVIGDNDAPYDGVTLTWHYDVPADREGELHAYFFDPSDSSWKLATEVAGLVIAWPNGDPAGERTDREADTISIRVGHLSIWGIFVGAGFDAPAATLDHLLIYPNPYLPNDGDPTTGIPYGAPGDGSGIYINGLVPGTTIEIYDLRGRLIDQFTVPAGTGASQWDVRNEAGEDVTTGVYFAVFKNGGEQRVEKIFVVR